MYNIFELIEHSDSDWRMLKIIEKFDHFIMKNLLDFIKLPKHEMNKIEIFQTVKKMIRSVRFFTNNISNIIKFVVLITNLELITYMHSIGNVLNHFNTILVKWQCYTSRKMQNFSDCTNHTQSRVDNSNMYYSFNSIWLVYELHSIHTHTLTICQMRHSWKWIYFLFTVLQITWMLFAYCCCYHFHLHWKESQTFALKLILIRICVSCICYRYIFWKSNGTSTE